MEWMEYFSILVLYFALTRINLKDVYIYSELTDVDLVSYFLEYNFICTRPYLFYTNF